MTDGTMGYQSYGGIMSDRLYYMIGNRVTVYFPSGAPVRGTLRVVGRDYIEVERMTDGQRESVLIPLAAVNAVTGPFVEAHY